MITVEGLVCLMPTSATVEIYDIHDRLMYKGAPYYIPIIMCKLAVTRYRCSVGQAVTYKFWV